MKKRIVFSAILGVWAFLVLGAPWYGPHDYISLEGFPGVQVVKTRRVDSYGEFEREVPVEYLIVRRDYELHISVDVDANRPEAIVQVRSERPAIALLLAAQQVNSLGYPCPSVGRSYLSKDGWIERPELLVFVAQCNPISYDELVMRFAVVDAEGPVAEERIPFRKESAGVHIASGSDLSI